MWLKMLFQSSLLDLLGDGEVVYFPNAFFFVKLHEGAVKFSIAIFHSHIIVGNIIKTPNVLQPNAFYSTISRFEGVNVALNVSFDFAHVRISALSRKVEISEVGVNVALFIKYFIRLFKNFLGTFESVAAINGAKSNSC